MVSDVITISSSGTNMDAALEETAKVAAYKSLSRREALHMRLLAEEMMGMMRSITHETNGEFWIESGQNEYELHLKVETIVDAEIRQRLLSASSSGKNEASRSFMGKLREFFFRGPDENIASYQTPLVNAGIAANVKEWQWSMARYQDNISAAKDEKPEAAEAWDELEKSVVRNVADDVKISIKGWTTEMIIVKKLG